LWGREATETNVASIICHLIKAQGQGLVGKLARLPLSGWLRRLATTSPGYSSRQPPTRWRSAQNHRRQSGNWQRPSVPRRCQEISSQRPSISKQRPIIPRRWPSVPLRRPRIPRQRPLFPSRCQEIPKWCPSIPGRCPSIPKGCQPSSNVHFTHFQTLTAFGMAGRHHSARSTCAPAGGFRHPRRKLR